MKLLLVSPCQYEHRRLSFSLRIPQISLNIIAALTPSYYEIKIVEEELEDVNFDEDCDIVGISTIADLMFRPADELYEWLQNVKLTENEQVIGKRIMQEINQRDASIFYLGIHQAAASG